MGDKFRLETVCMQRALSSDESGEFWLKKGHVVVSERTNESQQGFPHPCPQQLRRVLSGYTVLYVPVVPKYLKSAQEA